MRYYFLIFLRNIFEFGSGPGQFRYYFRWRRSLVSGSSSVKDKQPWLTFEVIDFFKEHLKKDARIFEYGGGGSTLFWLSRAEEVVTVEHDEAWFNILAEHVKKDNYKNWKGNFVLPGKDQLVEKPDVSDPEHYASDDPKYVNNNFREYATAINTYPDEYFDVVLIDGRARPSCIKQGMAKLRIGGYLVLDNSDREYYYKRFEKTLQGEYRMLISKFGACPYLFAFTKTSIWQKK